MIRPLSAHIGLRYTRAKRRNHFISFISLISMLGIAIGVWALITVLSVMNGFEKELRDRILGVASHVTINSSDRWLPGWQDYRAELNKVEGVIGQAPFISGQGMAVRGSSVNGALIRGVLPDHEPEVSTIDKHMLIGKLDDLKAGSYKIILGEALARTLGVYPGMKIILVTPAGTVTPAGMLPRMKRFTVSGVFKMGMYEYDSALALIHMEDAAKLYKSRGGISGIRIKLADVYQAPAVNRTLRSTLGPEVYVSDWTREHANFFRALKIEKRVMFIILFLVVSVAAFNIVSTLIMLVTDKQADIAILRTIGMTPKGIMGIFIVQGMVIGVIGTIMGAITGVLTALNIKTIVPFLEGIFGVQLFPADVYVISDFPAEMHWNDVTSIIIAALIVTVLATLYPAWRASRTQPADALRYE